MGLVMAADGSIVPPGRLRHRWETQFNDGLPPWLSLRTDGAFAGSTAPAYTGTGRGVLLTSDPSASKSVALVGQPAGFPACEALRFNLHCTSGADDNTTVAFGFSTPGYTAGALAKQFAGATTMMLAGYNAAAAETLQVPVYSWLYYGVSSAKPPPRYDLSLWITKDNRVYFGEGDNIDSVQLFTTAAMLLTGALVPIVVVAGGPGAAGGVSRAVHSITIDEFYL